MSSANDEFLRRLRETFKVEAAEHLQAITSGLLELEKTPQPQAQRGLVESVFRAAHSLKGAARAVEFDEIESLCGSLEDIFASWKRQESAPTAAGLDQLHGKLNAVAAILNASQAAGETLPAAAPSAPAPQPPAWQGEDFLVAPAPVMEPPPAAASRPVAAAETVRIHVAGLDAHLLEAEEMLAVKLAARRRVDELRQLAARLEAGQGERSAADPQAQLKAMQAGLAGLTQAAQQDSDVVAKLVDDLLENSKKLLLLPFSTISAPLPKLVRDQCRDQGKEADFSIHGEEIEIDKRILEELKDPLIHLLRNCVDHGIELPAERARAGKAPRARIRLAVSQAGGNRVRVTVSDDGAGIDSGKVKAAAIRAKLISPEEAAGLSEAQAQALVFRSDLSTSPIITQLSGRGLGLAIVHEKAGKLGGELSVDSQPGVGTVFRMILPALRTTFRGILVETAGQMLVLPTSQVERAARVRPDDIRTVEGRDTISMDGRTLPWVRLADALELPPAQSAEPPPGGIPLVVLGRGDERVAFAVDAVLDEQEILVKPLARPLSRVRNIGAATLLASGRIALVLNVADLLKSARRVAGAPARAALPSPSREAKAVLVAEDSITSRTLIRSILESCGYRVTTAVDGLDAFTRLRAGQYDLVVSDVEMPRLNGFDLTARIRADKKLAELPVVLVTALEARQDRERGIDVGANAYIVKSGFDQSTLVEAVRRLI